MIGGGEREFIALGSQAHDGSDRDIGEIRALPEIFPRVHVADMNLNKGNVDSENRISYRDAGVCERARIEQNEVRIAVLYAVDKFGFGVALQRLQTMAAIFRVLCQRRLDVAECRAAVDVGFPGAEKIQVRAVKQQ